VAAADDERRRIERNIHDGAQQRLVALSAHLTLATERARNAPRTAEDGFESAQAELQRAIDELRDLVHGIRPPALRRLGLVSAIELAAARSVIPVQLGDLTHQRLDETAETTAYYVVFEAIANAQRYSRASVIRVDARLTPGWLNLEVTDNGVGGAAEQDELGLQGLRDRVEATGGRFTVQSDPEAGTRIAARIPATAAK
jgi:signal transduction histidine kinase